MVKFYCSLLFILFCTLKVLSLNTSNEETQLFSRQPSNSPISKVFIFGKPYYIRDMKAKLRGDSSDFNLNPTVKDSRKGFSNQEQLLRDYVIRNSMENYYYQPPLPPQPLRPSYPSPPQYYYPSPPEGVVKNNQEMVITTYATTPIYNITTTQTTTQATTPLPPKKNNDYPLESCYTNKSGFMCCNEELEQLIHKTFNDLLNSRGGKWNKCNIQEIANKIQKNAQNKFNLNFESLAGIGDFASKSNFYSDHICKVEISGRYILAYASPVQPPKMFETPDSLPYHKIRM